MVTTHLQVQTKGMRDKKGKTPQQAYKDALAALENELLDIKTQFEVSYAPCQLLLTAAEH